MPLPVPPTAPTSCTAGDTVVWRLAAPDTPPGDGWAVRVTLAGPATQRADAAPDGDGYLVTFPAATTADLPAGAFTWTATATRGAGLALERVTVATGRLVVAANPETLAGDQRRHAERMLAAIEAVLEGRATKDVESYTFNGRSVVHLPIAELQHLRATYAAEVRALRRPGRFGRTIGVRFGRA